MLTYCFFAKESASPLKESLTYSLVSFYFSLRRVSLAEYFLVLRALFPFVVDGQMYYGYCINCVTEPTNYTKLSKKITRQSRRFSKLKTV
jgi:hypothetical protein